MDVEGYEPSAMASARRLIGQHGVDNIVMEYSPVVAEKVCVIIVLCLNPGDPKYT